MNRFTLKAGALAAACMAGAALVISACAPMPSSPPGSTTTTTTVVQSIETSVSSVSVSEGSTGSFGVRLAAAPVASVSVSVSSGDSGSVGVSPSSLTFTPANWNVSQTVVVSGFQDADTADEVVTVSVTSPGIPTGFVSVLVTDDDVL